MRFSFITLLTIIASCNGYSPTTDRILCIVNYNWPYYNSIPLIKKMYGSFFPHMVFYGPEPFPQVHMVHHFKGYFGYRTLIDAMTRYPDYDGYLYTNDDCMINIKNFRNFDCNKIWFVTPQIVTLSNQLLKSSNIWWRRKWGLPALRQALAELPEIFAEQLESHIGKTKTVWALSDVVYIPQRYKEKFKEIATVFSKHELFLEMAIPSLCCYLDAPIHWEKFNAIYLWGKDRDKLFKVYNNKCHFIHPVKLSDQKNVEFALLQLIDQS